MKKVLLFLVSFLTCICLTAFWASSVLDIDIPILQHSFSESVDRLTDVNGVAINGESINKDNIYKITIAGVELKVLSADPWIKIKSQFPKVKYIDIYFNKLSINTSDRNVEQLQIFYLRGDEEFSEESSIWYDVHNGRNILTLSDRDYDSLRIDFQEYPGSEYNIRYIQLSESRPTRIRDVIGLGIAIIIFGMLIWNGFYKHGEMTAVRLSNLKKYSYLLSNLVKKDFTTKYRRSILGVMWSVISPLIMATIISIVFSNLMRVRVENFTVFYLSGSLIYGFMSEATKGALSSVLSSAGLIKKVYIPKYIFPLEKCLFALINALFSFVALLIIMPILGVKLHLTIFLFPILFLYVLVFSVGLGMLLATANVFFRDVAHLYGVLILAWMYLTPILYPLEMLPEVLRAGVTRFNPMVHYVEYFRELVMYGTVPNIQVNLICLAWSLSMLMIGVLVFKLKQNKFILYV